MSVSNDAREVDQKFRTVMIVTAALLVSAAFYGLIIVVMSNQGLPTPTAAGADPTLDLLKYILAGLGVSMAAVSVFLKNFLLTPERIAARVAAAPPGPAAALTVAFPMFFQAQIISLALAESIAVYGVVIFFVCRDQGFAFGLIGLSLLTMIVLFPKRSQFDQVMEEAQKAMMMKGVASGR